MSHLVKTNPIVGKIVKHKGTDHTIWAYNPESGRVLTTSTIGHKTWAIGDAKRRIASQVSNHKEIKMVEFEHIGEKRLGEISTLASIDGNIVKYCDDEATIFHMTQGHQQIAVTIGAHTNTTPT